MNILVADDHQEMLQAICKYLVSRHYGVISACSNGTEAWNSLLLLKPDIALLDHNMPGMTGMEISEKIHDEHLPVKVVMITMHKERSIVDKAVSAGVKGYLLKDNAFAEIEKCLQEVYDGNAYYSRELNRNPETDPENDLAKLTAAEVKIVRIIASGKSSQQIAHMLSVSSKAVDIHKEAIIKKLKLATGPDSIALWAANNII